MSNSGKWSLVCRGKHGRVCPVCGHRFIAKNEHIRLCAVCKNMTSKTGDRRRRGLR